MDAKPMKAKQSKEKTMLSTLSSTTTRASTLINFARAHFRPAKTLLNNTRMDSRPNTLVPVAFSTLSSPLTQTDSNASNEEPTTISLLEWQLWGSNSPIPILVQEIVKEMKGFEAENDAQMSFGGLGGKLKGDFKVQENKKHRAKYLALGDSEQKLNFFSVRQIACRLLGSRGYLCQACWLPREDCMCSRVVHCSLWQRVRFWLYMHPKDFLRQNSTGKVLWEVFGVQAATLCIYGIPEHEDIMWNAFRRAGKTNVWCLYPNKNAPTKSVQDSFAHNSSKGLECNSIPSNEDETINFILIDGTWSNSAAMFKRLQERAESVWGDNLPCISLTTGASAMHRLRPQPSWDRTCTAAAAAGLLSELHQVSEFSSFELEKGAEAIENVLEVLLEALTARRLRMGRSIARRQRHHNDIC